MKTTVAVAVCLVAAGNALGTGQYLQFDGNDVVVIPNSTSLNPSQLTLECQVNFARLSTGTGYGGDDNQVLVMKGADVDPGQYHLCQLGFTDPSIQGLTFYMDWRKGAGTERSLQVNRWYHLAGTYDGSVAKLYLDGDLIATSTIGTVPVGNSEPLYLSYNHSTGFPFYLTGALDEVRVWSHARTQQEIRDHMWGTLGGSEAGLVGYWDFEEALDSQVAYDRTGYHNDGQLGWGAGVDGADPVRVPEPVGLSLLALGAAVVRSRRRRRAARRPNGSVSR